VTSHVARGCPQAPQHRGEFRHPSTTKFVEFVKDPGLDPLQDHTIRTLNLPIHLGCAMAAQSTRMWWSSQNLRNFFPMNCVPWSKMMEFGTPKWWIMLVKNFTASSYLIVVIGLISIHFELVNGNKQVRVALGRPL
jgi:hypothetical protein